MWELEKAQYHNDGTLTEWERTGILLPDFCEAQLVAERWTLEGYKGAEWRVRNEFGPDSSIR